MIRLRFTANRSLVSRAIRLFTWSDWSHVEMLIPAGMWGNHHDCWLSAWFDGGVELRPLDYTQPSNCIEATVLSDCDPDQVLQFALNQLGLPYDLGAIFQAPRGCELTHQSSWFCSELIAAAFDSAGFNLINYHRNRITPEDLYCSPFLLLHHKPNLY